jgi:hypothetical protein
MCRRRLTQPVLQYPGVGCQGPPDHRGLQGAWHRPDRVLIQLASTWEGYARRKIQRAHGIMCNMTVLLNRAQAVAYLISVRRPHLRLALEGSRAETDNRARPGRALRPRHLQILQGKRHRGSHGDGNTLGGHPGICPRPEDAARNHATPPPVNLNEKNNVEGDIVVIVAHHLNSSR